MKAIFNKQMIGPVVFFFAGLLFFTIGSGLTYRQRALEKQGTETAGTVVDLLFSTLRNTMMLNPGE
jgi:hypothetical protein